MARCHRPRCSRPAPDHIGIGVEVVPKCANRESDLNDYRHSYLPFCFAFTGHCALKASNIRDCDGGFYNVDLYVKKTTVEADSGTEASTVYRFKQRGPHGRPGYIGCLCYMCLYWWPLQGKLASAKMICLRNQSLVDKEVWGKARVLSRMAIKYSSAYSPEP